MPWVTINHKHVLIGEDGGHAGDHDPETHTGNKTTDGALAYSKAFAEWNNTGRQGSSPNPKQYGLGFSQALAAQDKARQSGLLRQGDWREFGPKPKPIMSSEEIAKHNAKVAARAKALGLR